MRLNGEGHDLYDSHAPSTPFDLNATTTPLVELARSFHTPPTSRTAVPVRLSPPAHLLYSICQYPRFPILDIHTLPLYSVTLRDTMNVPPSPRPLALTPPYPANFSHSHILSSHPSLLTPAFPVVSHAPLSRSVLHCRAGVRFPRGTDAFADANDDTLNHKHPSRPRGPIRVRKSAAIQLFRSFRNVSKCRTGGNVTTCRRARDGWLGSYYSIALECVLPTECWMMCLVRAYVSGPQRLGTRYATSSTVNIPDPSPLLHQLRIFKKKAPHSSAICAP
ncbi:hypothetical protein OF83DRAFT_625266 [Amylostereum chailletii]|nr:hypothetical protein OF83DRAFT_625266 [Amylostereum chailletii]